MTLIAVTGYKNSGKNEICNILHEERGFVITGFADALRAQMLAIDPIVTFRSEFSRTAFGTHVTTFVPVHLSTIIAEIGWDRAKEEYPEIRRLLQRGGTEGGRDIFGQDIWVETWYKTVGVLLEQGYDVCVSDMRFLNEARAVRDLFGEVWRVLRPGTVRGEHLSESQLDEIVPDRVIQNGSTLEDLRRRVLA